MWMWIWMQCNAYDQVLSLLASITTNVLSKWDPAGLQKSQMRLKWIVWLFFFWQQMLQLNLQQRRWIFGHKSGRYALLTCRCRSAWLILNTPISLSYIRQAQEVTYCSKVNISYGDFSPDNGGKLQNTQLWTTVEAMLILVTTVAVSLQSAVLETVKPYINLRQTNQYL